MKKVFKICIILFFIVYTFSIQMIPAFAASDVLTVTGIGEDLEKYNYKTSEPEFLNERTGTILGIVRVVGTMVSVGVLMVIGIKYMIGSVEEKAEYKKTFLLYIIGAFLLFTGTLLPSVIYDAVHNI